MRNPEFMPVKNGHRAKILYLNGQRTRIDFAMAPFIQSLHDLKIETFSCCQGSCAGGRCGRHHKRSGELESYTNEEGKVVSFRKRVIPKRCQETVYVGFPTPRDASRFLNVVYDAGDSEELRDQIRGEGSLDSDTWIWVPDIDGAEVPEENRITRKGNWIVKPKKPFQLTIGMLCLFPRAHLAMVTARVQKAASDVCNSTPI